MYSLLPYLSLMHGGSVVDQVTFFCFRSHGSLETLPVYEI